MRAASEGPGYRNGIRMLRHESLLDAIHVGDCLHVMAGWPNEVADLAYVALPVSDSWEWDDHARTRMDHIQRRPDAQGHDTALGLHIALGNVGLMAYIAFIAERLPQLIRILKPDGAICLVSDTWGDHYGRVLLDGFLGPKHYRGQFSWQLALGDGPVGTLPIAGSAVWYAKAGDTEGLWIPPPVVTVPADEVAGHSLASRTIARRAIATMTEPGAVVLEPCRASAAVAESAQELGRRWISIDCVLDAGLDTCSRRDQTGP